MGYVGCIFFNFVTVFNDLELRCEFLFTMGLETRLFVSQEWMRVQELLIIYRISWISTGYKVYLEDFLDLQRLSLEIFAAISSQDSRTLTMLTFVTCSYLNFSVPRDLLFTRTSFFIKFLFELSMPCRVRAKYGSHLYFMKINLFYLFII